MQTRCVFMSGHVGKTFFPIIILLILIIPIIASFWQNNMSDDVLAVDEGSTLIAGTTTVWHDDCSSTEGWISQTPSSGFDPKHPIFESGTLSSTSGYLIVTGISDPVTERKGPLFIKELGSAIPIDAIELFEAEVAFNYVGGVYGFLSIYLFDENKQKAAMLRLHDAWDASESHPESVFFNPGEIGDGTVHYKILFGSWSGHLRFWFDNVTESLVGELDDGTPNTATLKASGEFDPDRAIRYIGIQWSRHPGATYQGENYRLLDIRLEYDSSKVGTHWLSGWNYRKSHLLIGTAGAGANYQIQIIVNYGTGTDSNNMAYCELNCQPDFDDIRFTDNDGFTLLDYWRESYFESDNATFWVEVKDNLDSDVLIYLYFGNDNCTTASNGPATFAFFDDFEDGSIDTSRWNVYGPWIESGSFVSFSITGTGGTSILPDLMTYNTWDMRNKSIVSRWRVNQMTVNREWGVSCANTAGDDHTRLAYFLSLGDDYVRSYFDANDAPGYDYYNLIIGQYTPSVFMKTEFVSTPNNATKNSWILDGTVLDTYSGYSFDSTPQHIFLGFYVHGYTNTLNPGNLSMDFDYVFLRNEIGSEIQHGAWSSTDIAEPYISDALDFEYEVGTSGHVIVWIISNFTPTSYELYRDGGLLTSDTWPGGSQLEIAVDNLSPKEYIYTVIVLGDFGISVSDTVLVTVKDSAGPSLGHPKDITYEYGTTGHAIIWSVSDLYPDEYTIYKDEVPIESDKWTSGTITLSIDGNEIGEYNYTILVSDSSGTSAVDSVMVTVIDSTAPLLNHPSDIQMEFGTPSIQITWQPTDLLPLNYEMYQNDTLVSSGLWTNGDNLAYAVSENMTIGTYNITIIVWDTSGNFASDTVLISIRVVPVIVDYVGVSIIIGSLVAIVIIGSIVCKNRGRAQS